MAEQLSTRLEVEAAGLRLRVVRHHCGKPACRLGTLVAAEDDEDRWDAIAEVKSHAGDDELEAFLRTLVEDEHWWHSIRRGIAALGVPWDQLTEPILAAQMETLANAPEWFVEELNHWEPEQLRDLVGYLRSDQRGLAEALRLLRAYRLEDWGRKK